jgi:hypothetical protein
MIEDSNGYNRELVKRTKSKAQSTPPLRPYKDHAQMRERGSDGDWFSVEFLIYYDQSQIRTFAHVRSECYGLNYNNQPK